MDHGCVHGRKDGNDGGWEEDDDGPYARGGRRGRKRAGSGWRIDEERRGMGRSLRTASIRCSL